MFVTTFYSYKGGVGRTMALANVASELARRGKSILVADFDLEAPGLSSFAFNGCNSKTDNTPGLVDFIHHWLEHERAPDIRDFVCRHEDQSDPSRGPIFVMPAGQMDDAYGSRLRQIDFEMLYKEHDGFLLFEDIRAQWARVLKVDYVLIDSRTGHTDIGGICTRQLPDLITLVFWPNIQNLNGLVSILNEMEEQEKDLLRPIKRLFVPSNLPLLDDEGGVLKELIDRFRKTLSYDASNEVRIHNYPSLDLLEQKIFTRERLKSRLAREYKNLADAIISQNVTDVDGVKIFLNRYLREEARAIRSGRTLQTSARQKNDLLQQILTRTWEDSEINRMLALIKAQDGELVGAIRCLEAVIAKGDDNLMDHLWLAEWMVATGIVIDSTITVNRLLNDSESTQAHVIAALRLLVLTPTPRPNDLERRPAFQHLSAQELSRIADSFLSTRPQVHLVGSIIASTIKRDESSVLDSIGYSTAISIALILIGSGHFSEALTLLNSVIADTPTAKMRIAFNTAMATWGMSGEPPLQLFNEVIRLHLDVEPTNTRNANYYQCIGLAMGVIERKDEALEMLGQARSLVEGQRPIFSCWSYLERGQLGFAQDVDEMHTWIIKGLPRPIVYRENSHVDVGT